MTPRQEAQEAKDRGTSVRILDVAERLVQQRGFNGFSYADVAAELGVTKATLHYHFAGKAELGEELILRYARRFGAALRSIDVDCAEAGPKLAAYADLYVDVLRDRRMCLCGMLAADYETLPSPMRDGVVRFFDDNETWLAGVLEQGRAQGVVHYDGPARDEAQLLIGALEGAMLVARSYGKIDRFQTVVDRLLAGLTGGGPSAAPSPAGAAGQPRPKRTGTPPTDI